MSKAFDRLKQLLALKAPKHAPNFIFSDYADIQMGSDWEQALEDVGGSCRAFVFFVSPNFAQSDWCGREVGVALFRLRRWLADPSHTKKASFLFPILWEIDPLDELRDKKSTLPQPLQSFQFRPPGAPAEYATSGLRLMISLNKKTKVEKLLNLIASAIACGVEHGTLPELRPDRLKDIASAWSSAPEKYGVVYLVEAPDPQPISGEIVKRAGIMRINAAAIEGASNSPKERVIELAHIGPIFLLVIEEKQVPTKLIAAVDKHPSANVVLVILSEGVQPSGAHKSVKEWLTTNKLAEGRLWAALEAQNVTACRLREFGPQMEVLVDRARNAMILSDDAKSVPPAPVDGARAVLAKPAVSGPGATN